MSNLLIARKCPGNAELAILHQMFGGSPQPVSVAQIFNLPYRRFVIGGTLLAIGSWQL
jgi:hypothetical protein